MAYVYLKNCSVAMDIWDDLKTTGISKEIFITGTLCPLGVMDLNSLLSDLNNAIKNAGLIQKVAINQAKNLIIKAKGFAENKNIAQLKSLTSNSIVSLGAKALNADDKRVFDFIQNIVK